MLSRMAQPGGKGEYRDPQEEEEEEPPPPGKRTETERIPLPSISLAQSLSLSFSVQPRSPSNCALGIKKATQGEQIHQTAAESLLLKILEKQFECLISPVNSCVCLSFVQTIGEFKNSDCFLPTTFLLLFF